MHHRSLVNRGHNKRLGKAGFDLWLRDGTGRGDLYDLQGDGTWVRDEFFREISENPDDTHWLTFADAGTWQFQVFDHPDAPGKIASIIDRNGNAIVFDYDVDGRLRQITDTLDRVIEIEYNADGFISFVRDWAGREVKYEYYQDGDADGSFGDLKSATSPVVVEGDPNFPIPEGLGHEYPEGKTTTYTYTTGHADKQLNHNLLTITNGRGETYLVNEYAPTEDPNNLDFDRVVRQTVGDPGDLIDYFYMSVTPTPENHDAVIMTIVNDRVGHVEELLYNDQNALVIRREYTGQADPDAVTTEDTNRPIDSLRPEDPVFFETRWTRNEDALARTSHHIMGLLLLGVFGSASVGEQQLGEGRRGTRGTRYELSGYG